MARRKKRKAEEESLVDPQVAAPQASRLTPVDVQQKVFRLAFRGYNERDVDEFLDHVTETLASLHEDNKRLREEANEAGSSPAATAAAERQAAEIVRQAREHAARLVEAAERRVAEVGGAEAGPAAAAVSGSFLAREREFLQRMASLIQGHARTLKEESLRSRDTPAPAEGAATPLQEEPGGPPQPAADDVTAMPAREPSPPEQAPAAAGAAAQQAAPVAEPEERQQTPAPAPAEGGEEASTGSEFERPTAPPVGAPPSPEPPSFVPGPRESDEDSPSVPWRPSESESPAEAGWSVEGSGEEGDPLLSAWESAFLAKPEEESGAAPAPPPAEEAGTPPAPKPEKEKDRQGEEPSLRELFWGEE